MGSIISSVLAPGPEFASVPTSKELFNGHPAPRGGYEQIALVPAYGSMSKQVGVFVLPSADVSDPLYVFEPVGTKFFLCQAGSKGNKTRLAEIKVTLAPTRDRNTAPLSFEDKSNVGRKQLCVLSTIDGVEAAVDVTKEFNPANGMNVATEILGDWTLTSVVGATARELNFKGETMGALHEAAITGLPGSMENLKKPAGLYLKKSLSKEEKVQVIAIIATVSNRLIRIAETNPLEG